MKGGKGDVKMNKRSKGAMIAAYIVIGIMAASAVALAIFEIKMIVSGIEWVKGIIEQLIS